MKPQDIETQHVIMSCPVCDLDIVAKVAATVIIGAGVYDPLKNALEVPVTSRPTRFSVSHICTGPTTAADEAGR